MELIDTHCHLTSEGLIEQIDAVLERARDAGVKRCITIGEDPGDGARCVELAERHEGVFAAVGIHPHRANRFAGANLSDLRELLEHPRVVAAGEMGLDYHYDFSDRKSQWRVFEAQLETCIETDKPVVIHCREATEDVVRILKEAGFGGRRVVFHCFTGPQAEVRLLRDHGWRISLTGVVTFRNAGEIRDVAKACPADQIMVETDAPYLSPVPVRNVRPNEPAFVAHTVRFLAELRGQHVEELAEQTTRNAVEFFGLDAAEEAP